MSDALPGDEKDDTAEMGRFVPVMWDEKDESPLGLVLSVLTFGPTFRARDLDGDMGYPRCPRRLPQPSGTATFSAAILIFGGLSS